MNKSIIVHPHPIIEFKIGHIKMDESGSYAEFSLFNKEKNITESSFFVDKETAQELISLIQEFLDRLKE